jgi:phospholipase/carboxylesterase
MFTPLTRPLNLERHTEGFYASVIEGNRPRQALTFLPTGYEPDYGYPLLVMFHGAGRSERQVMQVAPRVSRRNHVCLGLRGSKRWTRANGRPGWAWEDDEATEEYIFNAIADVCENVSVHPKRIILVGLCEGAEMAYRLAFRHPSQFAGVVGLNGYLPEGGPLCRIKQLREYPVLMGHGIADSHIPLSAARRDHKLLYTAGMNVTFRTYPTTHRLHRDMLLDLDRWALNLVIGGAMVT